MPLNSQPVSTIRKLPGIADRTATNQLGKIKNLLDGQYGALGRPLGTGPSDTARVAREQLVVVHGGGKHCAQEPACLGSHGCRNAVVEQFRPPLSDRLSGDLPDRQATEIRRDVLGQQPSVQVSGPRTKAGTLRYPILPGPRGRPVRECRLGGSGRSAWS